MSSPEMNSSRFWMGWFSMPRSRRSTAPIDQMLEGLVSSLWRDTSEKEDFKVNYNRSATFVGEMVKHDLVWLLWFFYTILSHYWPKFPPKHLIS